MGVWLSEGRAVEGGDFIPITNRRIRWTVRPGDDPVNPRIGRNDAPFIVTIVDDNIAEPTEYFEVHYTVETNGIALPDAIARVTILDDDGRKKYLCKILWK